MQDKNVSGLLTCIYSGEEPSDHEQFKYSGRETQAHQQSSCQCKCIICEQRPLPGKRNCIVTLQAKCTTGEIDLSPLKCFLLPHLPSFTDNVPPIDAPINPPMVNEDTMMDQIRVRTSSDMALW